MRMQQQVATDYIKAYNSCSYCRGYSIDENFSSKILFPTYTTYLYHMLISYFLCSTIEVTVLLFHSILLIPDARISLLVHPSN